MDSVYDGFVSRHLNRRLSRPLARALSHTPATPNQVSFASLAVAALAFFSFVSGYNVLGGVLAQASSIVDGIDGDLARITGKTSAFGGFLDAILDRYADGLIILGLILWAATTDSQTRVWLAGFWALAGTFIVTYTRARITETTRSLFDRGVASIASRDVRLLIVMIGGILGLGFVTLIVIAALTNMVVVLRLIVARRTLTGE